MSKLKITYRKSAIGYGRDQKATIRSLGLRKLNSVVIHDDTPTIRGMVFKVRHLVSVEEIADDTSPDAETGAESGHNGGTES
ncbi:MAG: 50S ribosomal protein L30 [Roseiflexus sp.]|jgi:large subunit ribosomal protein L30|nr:50S ribosomal protein L30 [Roseiflexus sp.]MBO9334009.1 50S ribosomal protein L30 [Roseiflexus sp.]MBO9364387.1 50S ribosomal protein L30 [Roseiflexus sp.]MBO9382584.1 50S ribosomal protein L30 [Roseiflexus sp.]MBO9389696.1 50S ribosomal protein L30 [Roseiflexus sp.]